MTVAFGIDADEVGVPELLPNRVDLVVTHHHVGVRLRALDVELKHDVRASRARKQLVQLRRIGGYAHGLGVVPVDDGRNQSNLTKLASDTLSRVGAGLHGEGRFGRHFKNLFFSTTRKSKQRSNRISAMYAADRLSEQLADRQNFNSFGAAGDFGARDSIGN